MYGKEELFDAARLHGGRGKLEHPSKTKWVKYTEAAKQKLTNERIWEIFREGYSELDMSRGMGYIRGFSEEDVKALFRYLAKHPSINTLSLRNSFSSRREEAIFIECLIKNRTIKTLDLSVNAFTDADLARLIGNNHSITRLYIAAAGVGRKSLQALANNSSLRVVDMSYNISSMQAPGSKLDLNKEFLEVLQKNTSLEAIDITKTLADMKRTQIRGADKALERNQKTNARIRSNRIAPSKSLSKSTGGKFFSGSVKRKRSNTEIMNLLKKSK